MSNGWAASEQAFADAFVGFVRGFGLLDSDRTPCGAPRSVADAHALAVLRSQAQIAQGTSPNGCT